MGMPVMYIWRMSVTMLQHHMLMSMVIRLLFIPKCVRVPRMFVMHGGVHDTMRYADERVRVVQSSIDSNLWPSTTLRPKTKPTYFLEKTQPQGQLQKMGLPQNKPLCALLQDRVAPAKIEPNSTPYPRNPINITVPLTG